MADRTLLTFIERPLGHAAVFAWSDLPLPISST